MKKKLLALFLCCALSFGLVTAALITPASADSELMIYSDNVAVDAVSVPKNEKKTLAAGGLSGYYQWQIQVGGDVWANIAGATGAELEVGYALVANLLYGGTANIRCRVTGAAEEPVYSNTVAVQITDETPVSAPALAPAAPTVISEAEPVGEPTIIPPQTVEETPALDAAPAGDAAAPSDDAAPAGYAAIASNGAATAGYALVPSEGPAPAGDADVPSDDPDPANDTPDVKQTYNILIKYQFADGKQAANPWSATVAAGSTYTQTITSPVVVGYTPDKTTVEVNASEETTYIVTYAPAEVEFTVKHYQQNVTNDLYTLVDTETKTGYTESAVGEQLAKTYPGFSALLYDTTTKIAADGSTEVEVKYDRLYFLMSFNLDGGYGVEPIYARYGAAVNVETPEKPGYFFDTWTPEIPATMPAANSSHTASWKTGTAGFTVVFWYENADDNGYSVAGTYNLTDVAPGTEKKSDDYKDQSFTGRDNDHFTYNAAKAETVTVKGDGSTVLNVYYTRNTYTLTFVNHTHPQASCYEDVGDYENYTYYDSDPGYKAGQIIKGSYGNQKYLVTKVVKTSYYYYVFYVKYYGNLNVGAIAPTTCKTIKTITAKYQADIHGNFPIKDGNDTIWWDVPNDCKSFKPGTQLGSIDTMPGENITFTSAGADSGAVLWYYVETLNGAAGDYTHGGKNFKLYKKIDIEQSGWLTYTEEFHDITGFTQWWSDPAFDKMEQGGTTSEVKKNNYLCYTRNSYNLKFYNYNAYVDGKGGSVQFEAPLSGYDFTPDYPANLEPNAYVFAGWYTTSECYEGSEADLSTLTMPASDLVLYAKWAGKTHTVKAYQSKNALDNGDDALHTYDNVLHGTLAKPEPAHPANGSYTFAGWFYVSDTGEEKAFDFSMPVNRDLNLYAKWSSNKMMAYTVKYELEDGTEIAPPTTGSALAGTTKTFNAKSGTELNEGYQSGYFPKVGSHSITIDIDNPENNTFTFVYVPKAEVEYTVKYLEKGTEKQLADIKTVTTRDAVITETFKQITGYAPDAYQKQLVLAAEGSEIIFWYIKDDVHAPVQTIHWVQNIKGEGYAEYQKSTNLNGVIKTEYSETPLTITGFEYHSSPEHPVDGYPAKASGTLTEAGLVLNLYYDRIEYPYEFRFVEKDSSPEKQLADSITGTARYQAQVTQTAKAIPGYTLVSAENQAINIAIEDGNTAVKNVKTFYYTEQVVDIKYQVVGPDNCGTLDNYQESQLKVTTGTVKGAVPTAAEGFKFVGWYTDEACTQPVIATWVVNNKITPEKTKDLGNDVKGYEAATYYAKFEADVADLIISKAGCEDIDENQSFLFKVEGEGFSTTVAIQGNNSVKITGLKVGTYTVTEITNWSWRYTNKDNVQRKDITPQKPGDVYTFNFVNARSITKWLGGDAYSQNVFGTIVSAN